MVQSIRNIELAVGDGVKQPSAEEIKTRRVVRKAIVASCHIHQGDFYSESNLTVKRCASVAAVLAAIPKASMSAFV